MSKKTLKKLHIRIHAFQESWAFLVSMIYLFYRQERTHLWFQGGWGFMGVILVSFASVHLEWLHILSCFCSFCSHRYLLLVYHTESALISPKSRDGYEAITVNFISILLDAIKIWCENKRIVAKKRKRIFDKRNACVTDLCSLRFALSEKNM